MVSSFFAIAYKTDTMHGAVGVFFSFGSDPWNTFPKV